MPSSHPVYLVVGVVVLAGLLVEVVWTTMHRGGGPVTRLLTKTLWGLAVRTHHRFGRWGHQVMSVVGFTLVLFTVGSWILAVWGGWTLVFMGAPDAVLDAESALPASAAQRLYFTGFTAFTLGMGDFTPADHLLWQSLTILCSVSGFVLITFALAYLIPVVQNAVAKRVFASQVTALGAEPVEVLRSGWSGRSFSRLQSVLENAVEPLAHLRHAHRAYPVLHFFHEPLASESMAVAVARLDEAVRLAALTRDHDLDEGLLRQWDVLVDRFLAQMAGDTEGVDAPPPCGYERLRDQGVAMPSRRDFERAMRDDEERRRRLSALVHGHGWTWEAVCGTDDRSQAEVAAAERRHAA